MLLLQHLLLPSGAYEWRGLLEHLAGWYDGGHVYDWSTSDWLSMRVLHQLVTRCSEQRERKACCQVGR